MKHTISILVALGWMSLSIARGSLVVEVPVQKDIPDADASGMVSTVAISGQLYPIQNVRASLNVSGTYNGDLYAYLVHDSTIAVLLNRLGRTATDNLGYGDYGLSVTFDDHAVSGDVHNYESTSAGLLTGTWQPDGRTADPFYVTSTDPRQALLSSFTGLSANGDWTLFIADVSGGDEHKLVNWSLEIAAVPEPPTKLAGLILVALLVFKERRLLFPRIVSLIP